MAPPLIEIQNLTCRFGTFTAVAGVTCTISKGEFFSLLGPSGCGKTTLLRMLAGLESPSSGTLLMDGIDITHLPPYERKTNMVFQHYALFPHLTVEENVCFGLKYQKGLGRPEIALKLGEALKLVQMNGFETRYPHELSGGQRQRIALARALILKPSVLLLDEPMGALDQKLRREMQIELKNLQQTLGITFVLVTHDQEEALTMSDRIAVMNHGKIEQLAPAKEVFESPKTEFVARFMDAGNFFFEKNIKFIVRPEKMTLLPTPSTDPTQTSLEVTVKQSVYKGTHTVWMVQDQSGNTYAIHQQNLNATLPASLSPGKTAYACWNSQDAVKIE